MTKEITLIKNTKYYKYLWENQC